VIWLVGLVACQQCARTKLCESNVGTDRDNLPEFVHGTLTLICQYLGEHRTPHILIPREGQP